MCKQGTHSTIKVISNNIVVRLKTIDACIAPIVQTLNEVGIETVACCCGHGKFPGVISLKDGREILIARNYDEARLMESVIPKDEKAKKKCEYQDSTWCHKLNSDCWHLYQPEKCCEAKLIKSGERRKVGITHPEDFCQRCHGPNIIWYVDNELWNKYHGEYNILCPVCFAIQAGKEDIWKLSKEMTED
jgi:hypothetical protein